MSTDKVINNEALAASVDAPLTEKKMADTLGGKIANFFTFYVVGFVANSALSLGITYGLNPRPEVKQLKDNIANTVIKVAGDANHDKVNDSIRSSVEIAFMFIAGIIATTVMTPLTRYNEQIAHKINTIMGKDQDVLPEEMKPLPKPETIEQKIEQEIDKKIKKHSASDLWKSRIVSMVAVMGGDYLLNRSSRYLEAHDKPSVDTASWRAGMQLYKVLPEKVVAGWNKWFSQHGASIKDVEANMSEHFGRLQNTELKHGNSPSGVANENSMVVAEQARLVTKEVGWTLTLALFVDRLTEWFHKDRIKNERSKAIEVLKKEGVIPEGYKVEAHHQGITIQSPSQELPASSWQDKSAGAGKPENWVQGHGLRPAQAVGVSH